MTTKTTDSQTLYEVLGVVSNATPAQIKRAYQRLATLHHPDRATGNADRFKAITAAYHVLSDPAKRAEYDATGDASNTTADPLMGLAKSRLSAMLLTVLDVDTDVNIRQTLETMIDAGSAKVGHTMQQMQARKRKLTRKLALIKRLDGDKGLLHEIVESTLAGIEHDIEMQKRVLLVADKMHQILNDYEYNHADNAGGGFGFYKVLLDNV